MDSNCDADELPIGDRIVASLYGVAAGDVVGRAGGGHTPSSIEELYGGPISDLQTAIKGPHKMGGIRWKHGETSDDTVYSIAVAQSILKSGFVCRRSVATYLQRVPEKYQSYNSRLRGTSPSIDALSTEGQGGGAAMRVTPIGILWSRDYLSSLVRDVVKSSVITHADETAIAAACSTAAAITAAIDGHPREQILRTAIEAAHLARGWGMSSTLPPVGNQIESAYSVVEAWDSGCYMDLYERLANGPGIGRQATYLVPVAIALALNIGNAQDAILAATNLGHDSDTTASIAGAIAGAMEPDSLPQTWIGTIEQVNHHDLKGLALKLAALRNVCHDPVCVVNTPSGCIVGTDCDCRICQ